MSTIPYLALPEPGIHIRPRPCPKSEIWIRRADRRGPAAPRRTAHRSHERARNSMPFGQLNHSTWGLAWASRAVLNHSSPGFGCGVHHTVQICAPQPRARTTEILPLDAACLHNAASRMDHRGRQKVQLLIDGDVRQQSYRRVVPAWRSVSRVLGQGRATPAHVAKLRHTVRNPLAQHAGEPEGANAGRGRRRPPWRSSERKPRRTRIKYA